MLRLLLNIVWVLLAGLVMVLTIIGIPWARACFVIGMLTLWPFGSSAVNRRQVTGNADIGTGGLGCVGNVVWFVLAGWWLALGHVFAAVANFITIIGIPFGIQHLKFAVLALAPIGKTVVDKDSGQPLW